MAEVEITTVRVEKTTKERLESLFRGKKSWNEFLNELAEHEEKRLKEMEALA